MKAEANPIWWEKDFLLNDQIERFYIIVSELLLTIITAQNGKNSKKRYSDAAFHLNNI